MATIPEPASAAVAPPNILDEKAAAKTTEAEAPAASSSTSTTGVSAPQNTITTEAQRSTTPTNPRKSPFSRPIASFKPTPPQPLPADQEAKYQTVLTTVLAWQDLPTTTTKNPPKAPLAPHERQWLTRECLLRYLRATKWVPAEATKRLSATLVWRREYGTDGFTADYISIENATGKQVLAGFDNDGRPCLYLLPSRQNTKLSDRQVHHLVYMVERTLDMLPPGQEAISLLIDYAQSSSGQGPPLKQGKAVLDILQNHYPERLGRALILHVPWFLNAFYKLISPLIDPVTKSKMKFNEDLTNHVPAEQLLSSHGGQAQFEYDHDVFWPALTSITKERRDNARKSWEARGSKIGDSEWILKGGDPQAVEGILGEKADGTEALAQSLEKTQIGEGQVKPAQ